LRALVAVRTQVIFDDGPDFIAIARAMARGDFGSALAHPFHPLYSMLIWLTPGSAGSEEAVGVGWSVMAGVATVLLLWWLLRPLFGPRVAVTGALLLAAHPYAVRISADVQSDTVYLAFFLLGLGLVQRAGARADAGLAFAAGVASSLAYLTRPEGVGILAIGIAAMSGGWVQGRFTASRLAACASALLGGFGLLALPYMRVIWVLSGEWQLTQKKSIPTLLGVGHLDRGVTTWFVLAAVLAGAGGLALWARRRGGITFAWWHGGGGRKGLLVGLGLAFVAFAVIVSPSALARYAALFASTLRPELLVVLVAGVIASATRTPAPTQRSFFFVTAAVVYGAATFALLVTAGYLSRRHLLPLAVILLGYAALGVHAIADRVDARWRPRASTVTRSRIALALVMVLVAVALPKTLRLHREEGVAARVAAEWVRDMAASGDRLATDRPRTAYYAGLVWVPIRGRNGLHDGAALRRLGVRWIIAGKRELVDPDSVKLAVKPAPGQRFELVREFERRGFRALVFEVHEPSPAADDESPGVGP
jgi:4-amino-4-deoxy-L-arabinose transferase-like glycosyltransferase